MTTNLLQIIRNCKIFSTVNLDENSLTSILSEVTEIELEKNITLFEQGDPSDCFYIVIKGKLIAYFTDETADKIQIIGQIHEGETVGELGAISGKPRSLCVMTVEKSSLLKISSEQFKILCQRYPTILAGSMDSVISRSQKVIQLISAKNIKEHVAILPAHPAVMTHDFEVALKNFISTSEHFLLISDADLTSDENENKIIIDKLIQTAEENHQHIIYLLQAEETSLSKRCWINVNKIYVLANGNTTPSLSSFTENKINHSVFNFSVSLILVYNNQQHPTNTAAWLRIADFNLHHHVRVDNKDDLARLMRFIKGNPIGLVLSGGGAKGLAHVGVIKALKEAGIPIDALGGTSAGATVAALHAMHTDYEKIEADFQCIVAAIGKVTSLRNLVWPKVSIFNCRLPTQETKRIFGDHLIEDLWLPLYTISCNINRYIEVIHREGKLWEAVRASVSLPGLVPPMVIDGELHVDGGLINNLPVNVMRNMLGPQGRIIAVDLFSNVTDNNTYSFSPEHTLSELVLGRFNVSERKNRYPNFLDFFIKSLLIGSSVTQMENSKNADLLIQPETRGINMLKPKSAEEKEKIFALGYSAAQKIIPEWLGKNGGIEL